MRVFSKKRADMVVLEEAFGGNYYKHGAGFVWVLGNRERLLELVESLSTVPPNLEELRSLR